MILRYLRLICGLFLYALGVMLTVSANLGLAPWDVLSSGVSKTIGISFGQAIILVGLIIVVFLAIIRERLGIGTILNMILIGWFADLIRATGFLPAFEPLVSITTAPTTIIPQVLTMIAGLFVIAIGSVVYIGAGLCTGPRDGLMVYMRKKTRLPVGACRAIIEGCAVVCGYMLGGSVGIGTLISVICIGPIIQITFKSLKFKPETVEHEALSGTVARVRKRVQRRGIDITKN